MSLPTFDDSQINDAGHRCVPQLVGLATWRNAMMIEPMETNQKVNRFSRFDTGQRVILPSLLQCDFGNLQLEIEKLQEAGVQGFHLDVMDGHFVPNFTYGMPIVAAARRATDLPLDVHLMMDNPGDYIDQFADAGADCLTVHAEIGADLPALLGRIRELGVAAGLAINPQTELEKAEPYLNECDLFLVMGVNAGFGGQAFNPVAIDRLQSIRSSHPELILEVDGGVNSSSIGACVQAGANLLVVGSAIFDQDDYGRAMTGLSVAMDR
jgi:ribulose-phosphate 3-epimerase